MQHKAGYYIVRDTILKEASEFGFNKVQLNIEDGLLFIVTKDINPRASANFVVFLRESLEIMLGCKVTVTDEIRIKKEYKTEILRNSVNLDTDNDTQLIEFLLKDTGKTPDQIVFQSVEIDEKKLSLCGRHKEEVKRALQGQEVSNERVDQFFALLPRVKRPSSHQTKETVSKYPRIESFQKVRDILIIERINSQEEFNALIAWLETNYLNQAALTPSVDETGQPCR